MTRAGEHRSRFSARWRALGTPWSTIPLTLRRDVFAGGVAGLVAGLDPLGSRFRRNFAVSAPGICLQHQRWHVIRAAVVDRRAHHFGPSVGWPRAYLVAGRSRCGLSKIDRSPAVRWTNWDRSPCSGSCVPTSTSAVGARCSGRGSEKASGHPRWRLRRHFCSTKAGAAPLPGPGPGNHSGEPEQLPALYPHAGRGCLQRTGGAAYQRTGASNLSPHTISPRRSDGDRYLGANGVGASQPLDTQRGITLRSFGAGPGLCSQLLWPSGP